MKKLFIVILTVILAFSVLSVAKDQIARYFVVSAISKALGTRVSMGSLSVGILKNHSVRIKDFKLYNPAGFPQEPFLNIPSIKVDYDLKALLSGRVRLPVINVDLKEVVVVTNKEGKMNVNSLKTASKQEKARQEPAGKRPALKKFQVDKLILSVGRVVSKDLSAAKPVVKAYSVQMKNKEYDDITDLRNIVFLLLEVSLASTPLKGALIYDIAAASGVGIAPLMAIAFLTGQDRVEEEFSVSLNRVYAASIKALNELGEVIEQNKAAGFIRAKVGSNDVTVDIARSGSKTKISVSAKQAFIYVREAAAGVLYEIEQELE